MRESGYYRVKIKGFWEIAFYAKLYDTWRYSDLYLRDPDFEAIDENRIDPEPEKERGITITKI